MKTKHTKGPWHVDPRVTPLEVTVYSGGVRICNVKSFKGDPTKDEADANAKLIAAAPDLLEVLVEAQKHHQGGHSEIGFKIREAIKKATL